jgi:hypothetical protein
MMSVNNPIQIVRALWGNNFNIHKEVPKTPIFKNEIVLVWGIKNQKFLKNFGYSTILIGDNQTNDELYNSYLKHYGHKLEAIKLAENMFDEYLFLDWDVDVVKELDDEFYNLIRSGNNIQCPIYAYSKNYKDDIISYHRNNGTSSDNLENFLKYHLEGLTKYSWNYNDLYVIPNFCFFYSNKTKSASELHKLMFDNNLITCIEEFAMWIYSDCTLDEYIFKYEPIVIRGKERDISLPTMDSAFKTINKYVDSKIEKKIYLYHELQATNN